jgi:hypothetical protein
MPGKVKRSRSNSQGHTPARKASIQQDHPSALQQEMLDNLMGDRPLTMKQLQTRLQHAGTDVDKRLGGAPDASELASYAKMSDQSKLLLKQVLGGSEKRVQPAGRSRREGKSPQREAAPGAWKCTACGRAQPAPARPKLCVDCGSNQAQFGEPRPLVQRQWCRGCVRAHPGAVDAATTAVCATCTKEQMQLALMANKALRMKMGRKGNQEPHGIEQRLLSYAGAPPPAEGAQFVLGTSPDTETKLPQIGRRANGGGRKARRGGSNKVLFPWCTEKP